MRKSFFLIFVTSGLLACASAHAQSRAVALKSGESVELQQVWYIANCRSILTAPPEVEVLDGPAELTLAVKPGMVLPRRAQCAKPVMGGTIVATAGEITEPIRARLTYRTKYKTKDGDRQVSRVYTVSLFP